MQAHSAEATQQQLSLQAIQKSIYAFEKLYPETTTYHHTVAMELKGELQIEVFKAAIKELTFRHEALRSKFIESNGAPLQVIEKNISIGSDWPLKMIENKNDFTAPLNHLSDTLSQLNEKDILHKPFNLHDGPLWRCALIKLKENHYQFLMVFHHIMMDMYSQNILLRDLSHIYNSLIEKKEIALPSKPKLIEAKKTENKIENKIEFWKQTLEELPSVSLHSEFPRQKDSQFKGDRIRFNINPTVLNNLKEIAKKNNVSLHMLLLTSLYVLLYRYTGQTDLCIGTTSANRRNYPVEINHLVNCFINSVPLRLNLDGDPQFDSLLQKIKKTAVSAYQHQLPLHTIIEKTSITSPFNIMFVLYSQKTSLTLQNVEASYPIELNLHHAKFDAAIAIDEHTHECTIEFNTNLFKPSYFRRFKGHLETLWEGIINNPKSNISNLPLLTDSEKKVLEYYNDTKKEPHFTGFVHELVSRQARKNPGNIAIVFHKEKKENQTETKESITYAKLDKITNKLAAYLMNIGVGPEIIVGVSLSRSINLLIAMLAIYKAGGVVVPLETTNTPLLHYKISDTHLNIMFVDDKTKPLFTDYESSIFQLNMDDMKSIKKVINILGLVYSRPTHLSPANLAYIRYTSGTTSDPKGVMICHAGLTNLANALVDRTSLKSGSKILSTAQATFDAIEFDLLETWVTGGTLHLINDSDHFSPDAISQIIKTEKINAATLLPHMIKKIEKTALSQLSDLVSMGEIADQKLMSELSEEKNLVLRDEWGVTEATICSTENPTLKGIGKPIRNTKMFIINSADGKNECPVGVPGEIWVAGEGLARGYVGKPELTLSKFPVKVLKRDRRSFEDPEAKINMSETKESNCGTHHNTRKKIKYNSVLEQNYHFSNDLFPIYKTGDLGCRLEDGSIDFLGRMDSKQMKIKGVRVELIGMETVLSSYPEIKQAIVMPYPGQMYPVAYLMTNQKQLSKKDINTFLSQTPLPSTARLSAVVCLNSFPLTQHGKINTKAFPSPCFDTEMKVSGPQTNLQLILKKIWSHILEISEDSFEANEEFSKLGGDSITFAYLGIKINNTLPLNSPVNVSLFSLDDTIVEMEKKLQPFLKSSTEQYSPRLFKASNQSEEKSFSSAADHKLSLSANR